MHTQWNGRKTFCDIREGGQDGILQFKFRNLWNQPTSDIAYIRDLEKENKKLLLYIEEMWERFTSVQAIKQNSQKLITDTFDTSSSKQMQEGIINNEERKRLNFYMKFVPIIYTFLE